MWHDSTHTICVINWCVFKPIRMSIVLLVTCTCMNILCVYTEKISSMLQSHARVVYEKTSTIERGFVYASDFTTLINCNFFMASIKLKFAVILV